MDDETDKRIRKLEALTAAQAHAISALAEANRRAMIATAASRAIDSIVTGMLGRMRLDAGKDWLELVRTSALSQIPNDVEAAGNVEARAFVNDLIDRLELAAQSAEGRKGMN